MMCLIMVMIEGAALHLVNGMISIPGDAVIHRMNEKITLTMLGLTWCNPE